MASRVQDAGMEPRSYGRPDSQYYTEFEDDDSEVEYTSLKSSNQSVSQLCGCLDHHSSIADRRSETK